MSTRLPLLPLAEAPSRTLAEVLAPVEAAGLLAAPLPEWAARTRITHVTNDSRDVKAGALFGAIAPDTPGGSHGYGYVASAVAAGASAVLVGTDFAPAEGAPTFVRATSAGESPGPSGKGTLGKGPTTPGRAEAGAVFVSVTDTRAALAEAASAFYGHPAEQIALVGITGTNGKTTVGFLVHHMLTALGHTAGLVGTVENRIGAARYATRYTTPEAPELQRLLAAMVDAGVTHTAMEVSSHGLALDRVRAVPFAVGVFTNLTHDHLDFHGTADAYESAKRRLFDGLAPGATAVVNADDPAHARMTAATRARIVTYGTAPGADVPVRVVENGLAGLRLVLDGRERTFRLAGRFNALNLAAAYAAGVALGFDGGAVLDALADAPGVPGRFETVRSAAADVLGVVDYAHTPDALDNVLATAREITPEGGRLWVVFGCGGDRDRAKRPAMGRVASALADRVVLTSDNPRSEDPEAILDDVAAGMGRPPDVRTVDRAEAIARASAEAAPGDVIVVAGKGHETYQIVGAETRDFDDRAHLAAALATRTPVSIAPGAA